jgi:hypothetical protein
VYSHQSVLNGTRQLKGHTQPHELVASRNGQNMNTGEQVSHSQSSGFSGWSLTRRGVRKSSVYLVTAAPAGARPRFLTYGTYQHAHNMRWYAVQIGAQHITE